MDASPLRTVTILASPFSERCVFLQGVTRRFSDRLLDKLESHARQHGWEIVARITDDGYSGTNPTRPGLLQIVRLAQEGQIDAALATKRDRFYRSRLLRLATDQDLEDHGVKLLALDDTGHMVADSMLDSFAEYERTIIRDRLMDGKRRKAHQGEIPGGGHAPYGFSWTVNDNGKQAGLVPNGDMETVRMIFEMVARGDSLHTIAHALSAVPTPRGGRRWHPNTIARIMRNECYKGIYHYGKHRTVRTPGRDKKRRDTPLQKEEWIAVPVADSGIPHELIDAARGKLDARYRPRPRAECSRARNVGAGLRATAADSIARVRRTDTTSAMHVNETSGCALMVPVGTRINWNVV